MKKIAPSERMEQELMQGVWSSGDPLGEAARRGAQLILLSDSYDSPSATVKTPHGSGGIAGQAAAGQRCR